MALMSKSEVRRQSRALQAHVPQSAPGLHFTRYRGEIDAAIARVVGSGRYVLGAECEAFEKEFAEFLDAPFVVGINSGTDALSLALLAAGVEPGQEVIVPALTAAATAVAVRRIGATVRFVDVEPETRGINPTALADTVSARTGAVVVVHLHGMPASMREIAGVAAMRGLPVIEDCAHAHGATIGGRCVGTLSAAAAFSFYPTKNLGTMGDGGAAVVHSREQAERLRRLRYYGQDANRICREVGINSRLDEIQAAILRVLLTHLRDENGRRKEFARRYDEALAPLAAQGRVKLPRSDPGAVYHQYAIEVVDRDGVREALRSRGIATGVHYSPSLPRHPAFGDGAAHCPVADKLADTLLSLPIQPELMERQPLIIEAVCDILGSDPG
jgi:dTDP-4-amino-4,6-dideoxygalactose transaminase